MKKTRLADQLDPLYGYDENGLWRGMTREQVAEMCAEMAEKSRQRMMLHHWKPPCPPS